MSGQDKAFYFLHVMKTGGTSLQRRILANFDPGRTYPSDEAGIPPATHKGNVPAFRSMPADERARFDFFTVHMPFWVIEPIAAEFRLLTVLRHPVERVLSHMQQATRQLGLDSVEEVWRHPLLGPANVDYQLKQFSQNEEDMPPVEAQEEVKAGRRTPAAAAGMQREVDEPGFLRGLARLEQFEAVGFTDDLEMFLDSVADRYGWRIAALPPQNVSQDLPVSNDLKAEIESALDMDLRFYHQARTARDPRVGGTVMH